MRKEIAPIFIVMLCIISVSTAWAFDSRLELDHDVSLDILAQHGHPTVKSGRTNGSYWADASAVLSQVDLNRLFAAAQDYDHYTDFGMPFLKSSKVVERQSPEHLFTWASMTYSVASINISSQYYLEVMIRPALDAHGARGMEWQVTHKKSDWTFPDNHPRFSKNDGSFYILPLPNGKVYVRYFVTSDIKVPLGRVGRFFGGNKVIQGALRDGSAKVITVLKNQTATPR